jgi:hypothetical protein
MKSRVFIGDTSSWFGSFDRVLVAAVGLTSLCDA